MMRPSTHTDVCTYGGGTHTQTDTRSGQGAELRTEATHKHARTHREAKSKMHSDHMYPEGQTREDAQTPAEAYTDIQNSRHAAAHTTTKRGPYTVTFAQSEVRAHTLLKKLHACAIHTSSCSQN